MNFDAPTRAADAHPSDRDNIAFLDQVGRAVLDDEPIEFDDALRLIELTGPDIHHLFAWANRIRERHRGNKIHLCSIINVKSGGCAEDCKFCAQSVHYETGVEVYPFLSSEETLPAAVAAKENKAQALGIVAAWRGLKEGRLLDEVCERITEIAKSGTVRADASLGLIESRDVAQRLKDAGLVAYNHNLETARSHFPRVCTTHTWRDRVQTIRYLKEVGVKICSGGIIGMGETLRQRVELAFELRELDVDIVPINFLHQIHGTPMMGFDRLTPLECLQAVAVFRFVMPTKEIMIAGGRQTNLGQLQSMVFFAGASAMLIGHYLTTQNRSADDDLRMIEEQGLTWEWSEH